MNVLVFDPSRTLSSLTKAFLLARGHRVSISLSDLDARNKIETALFDALFLCSASVSPETADALRTDFSHVGVIRVGPQRTIETQHPLFAQLTAPFSPVEFNRVMENLEVRISSEEKTFDIPVDLAAGSDRLLCKATRVSPSAFILEGPPDHFSPFLENHGETELTATWRCGEKEFKISAEVIFDETSGGRWAGLRCRKGALNSLLAN